MFRKNDQLHYLTAFPLGKERQQPLDKRLRSTTTQEKLSGLVITSSDKAQRRGINIRYAKKPNCGAFSPQANYTDRAKLVPNFADRGVAWSAQRIPTAVYLGSLDRCRYFSIQVAPQLSSRGWVHPVPDPLLLRKFGRAGNRTRDLWICSQELWLLDHRDSHIKYAAKINYTADDICIKNSNYSDRAKNWKSPINNMRL
jgi:hypothetical protein